MNNRIKASLLWGVVGSLSFLVALQAYHLLGGEFVGVGVMVAVAVTVGGITAGLTHLLRPWLRGHNRETER